jgi:hypothetical protein
MLPPGAGLANRLVIELVKLLVSPENRLLFYIRDMQAEGARQEEKEIVDINS